MGRATQNKQNKHRINKQKKYGAWKTCRGVKEMTTKIKLTLVEIALVIVLAAGMLTAVQASVHNTAAGFVFPDVAGDSCSDACVGG